MCQEERFLRFFEALRSTLNMSWACRDVWNAALDFPKLVHFHQTVCGLLKRISV